MFTGEYVNDIRGYQMLRNRTKVHGGEDCGSAEVARTPLDFFLRFEECLVSSAPRLERFLYILRFRFLSRSLMYESKND